MPSLTVAEVAEDLGLSEAKIRRDIDSGILPAYQFGISIRIDINDFNDYKEKSRKKPKVANDNQLPKQKKSYTATRHKLNIINKEAKDLGLQI